jgi:cytochrome P450
MENVVYEIGTVGLVNKIEKNLKTTNIVDLFNEFHRSTFDVIFMLFFGTRVRVLERSWIPLIAIFRYLFLFLAMQSVLPFIEILSKILIIINITIIKVTWYYSPPKKDENSVLSQFFDAKDPDTGKKLTDAEVLREVLVIVGAGMDTTAVSLSWIFWVMGMNPEAYKSIQKEIDNVFPNSDMPLSAEICRTMLPITEAVILECMRLYPATGEYLPRTAPQGGTILGGYDIPGDVSWKYKANINYYLIILI